jgi:hypothetical protein
MCDYTIEQTIDDYMEISTVSEFEDTKVQPVTGKLIQTEFLNSSKSVYINFHLK